MTTKTASHTDHIHTKVKELIYSSIKNEMEVNTTMPKNTNRKRFMYQTNILICWLGQFGFEYNYVSTHGGNRLEQLKALSEQTTHN